MTLVRRATGIDFALLTVLAVLSFGLACAKDEESGGGTPTSPGFPSTPAPTPTPVPSGLTVVTSTGARIGIQSSSLRFAVNSNSNVSIGAKSYATCSTVSISIQDLRYFAPIEDIACGIKVCGSSVGCSGESWKVFTTTSTLSGYYQTSTNSSYGIRYTRSDNGATEYLSFRNLLRIE